MTGVEARFEHDPFFGEHAGTVVPPEPRRPRARTRPPLSPNERAAELTALDRQVRRDRRRDLLLAAVEGGAALGGGLLLLGWSLHTTDATTGELAFLGGLAIGNAGMLLALVRAQHRAEERGDRCGGAPARPALVRLPHVRHVPTL